MSLKKKDIELYRGDSRTLEVTVKDGAGALVDISGASAKFSVKKWANDAGYVIQKTSGTPSEITITDPVGGILEVYLVPADTENVSIDSYEYDVELTTAAGKVYTVVRGKFTVPADITRP